MNHRCLTIYLIVFGYPSLCLADESSWVRAFPDPPKISRAPNRWATMAQKDNSELKALSGERKDNVLQLGTRTFDKRTRHYVNDTKKFKTVEFDAFLAAYELARRFVKEDKLKEALAVLEQDKEMAAVTTVYRAIIYERLKDYDKATSELTKGAADESVTKYPIHNLPNRYFGKAKIHTCLAVIYSTFEDFSENSKAFDHITAARKEYDGSDWSQTGVALDDVAKRYPKNERFPDSPTLIVDYFFSKDSK